MVNEQLTGERRYRAHKCLFRTTLLVLQVEVHVTGREFCGMGGSRDVEYKYWRDAGVKDLNVFSTALSLMAIGAK